MSGPKSGCLRLQVAPMHDRLASELLSVLTAAGFVSADAATGVFTATAAVDSPATIAALAALPAAAEQLATEIAPQLKANVLLIEACMKALPRILTSAD